MIPSRAIARSIPSPVARRQLQSQWAVRPAFPNMSLYTLVASLAVLET
jgi:hypothetical protein